MAAGPLQLGQLEWKINLNFHPICLSVSPLLCEEKFWPRQFSGLSPPLFSLHSPLLAEGGNLISLQHPHLYSGFSLYSHSRFTVPILLVTAFCLASLFPVYYRSLLLFLLFSSNICLSLVVLLSPFFFLSFLFFPAFLYSSKHGTLRGKNTLLFNCLWFPPFH